MILECQSGRGELFIVALQLLFLLSQLQFSACVRGVEFVFHGQLLLPRRLDLGLRHGLTDRPHLPLLFFQVRASLFGLVLALLGQFALLRSFGERFLGHFALRRFTVFCGFCAVPLSARLVCTQLC